MADMIVKLTDVEWGGFLRNYWLAIVLNLLFVAGYIVAVWGWASYLDIACSSPIYVGKLVGIMIMMLIPLAFCMLMLNVVLMDDCKYWEHRGIKFQTDGGWE